MSLAMSFFKCQTKFGKQRVQEIGHKINSRLFEKLTIAAREYKRQCGKSRLGCKNPSYGKKWITNEIENRLLLHDEADLFLKNNPTWHYGQKFAHRKSSMHKHHKGTSRKGIKMTLTNEEIRRRRE